MVGIKGRNDLIPVEADLIEPGIIVSMLCAALKCAARSMILWKMLATEVVELLIGNTRP